MLPSYRPCPSIEPELRRNLAALLRRLAEEWRPRDPVPTARFAQSSFYLSPETSEQHGLFDLYYAPALYGIFSALDDPAVSEVVCMKGAQQAWTTGLMAYLANRIVNQPCAMIGLFDSDGAARDFHDEKLVPIVENTPALLSRINIRQSRSSGNRSDFKRFPGGFLKLGGSGQIRKVKSTSAGILFVEEPDDAKENLRDQGSAIQLLWERAKRRTDVKRIIGGTPSLKGLSQIEFRVALSDKRVLPVRCHECGQSHVLDLCHVTWSDHQDLPHPVYGMADPDTARYACPHCGSLWDDFRRQQNIRDTVASAIEAGDPLCGWTPTRPFHGSAGFHELNEAYSCLPGVGLAGYVRDRLEAEHAFRQGDNTKMIVLVNSKEGRPYEFKGEHATADALRAAALHYPEGQPPAGALTLTAGIDVQHNRIALVVRAYGREAESWLVLWTEIHAAVATANKDDPVWAELDRLVFRSYPSADGLPLCPLAVTVDSGDGTNNDAVYHWVTTRAKRHPAVTIMAGKGASTDVEIFQIPGAKVVNPLNPHKTTKADRWGLRIYRVGTWRAKDYLSARWRQESTGHGRHHAYADVRDDYWTQITSEVKAPSKQRGGKMAWTPKIGVPSEALDCEVYAEHAARSLKIHVRTPAQWASEEQRLRQTSLFDAPPASPPPSPRPAPVAPKETPPPAPPPVPRVPPPPVQRPRSGGFVGGWRR